MVAARRREELSNSVSHRLAKHEAKQLMMAILMSDAVAGRTTIVKKRHVVLPVARDQRCISKSQVLTLAQTPDETVKRLSIGARRPWWCPWQTKLERAQCVCRLYQPIHMHWLVCYRNLAASFDAGAQSLRQDTASFKRVLSPRSPDVRRAVASCTVFLGQQEVHLLDLEPIAY